ncbi:hypothetical protein ACFE04_005646 [Oxalis oulophora]
MGKTGKWFKSFLTGKKDKLDKERIENSKNPNSTPQTYPKDKKRWSFRRSSSAAALNNTITKDQNIYAAEQSVTSVSNLQTINIVENVDDSKKHAVAVAVATAAAADAAVAAAQAAADTVMTLTAAANRNSLIEEAAAVRIQSVFRSYLARKALRALRGLVKLQALVRGNLVRRQATATLRCMQALVIVQARARANRIKVTGDGKPPNHRQSTHRRSTPESLIRHTYVSHHPMHNFLDVLTNSPRKGDMDRNMEENIKIVEMDHGDLRASMKTRNSYSVQSQTELPPADHRFSAYYPSSNSNSPYPMQEKSYDHHVSPSPSAITDMSPRTCSGHIDDYSDSSGLPFAFPKPDYAETLSYIDYPLFPSYMANTESSRAKVRSQSAPKSRPADSFERQMSRRRASIEGRNIPRGMRMRRSSSQVGATVQNYQFQWALKLDRSSVSLKDSECGSTTSTVLTNTTYCKSAATEKSSVNLDEKLKQNDRNNKVS